MDEIEVTPEMIAEGEDVVLSMHLEDHTGAAIAEAVFKTMLACRSRSPMARPESGHAIAQAERMRYEIEGILDGDEKGELSSYDASVRIIGFMFGHEALQQLALDGKQIAGHFDAVARSRL